MDSAGKKLFFILYYLKTYCTFDVLGFHFDFSSGHAHEHVGQLLPVLQRSLAKFNVLPLRALESPADLRQLVEKSGDLFIDGVEVACVRSQDEAQQKACYSGKKRHTMKALVVASLHMQILLLSQIVPGSVYGYALLKQAFNPNEPWFDDVSVWLDLGFYGARKDYGDKADIHLPHKKPRKSKKNPNPELTAQQK